ncbi:hypothetical protein F4779DRAFT_615562 [Xylariaceae sp. FL0662B]|nr:hypothetical protein F4779DRAFT_615562 [Xylariaceae sp. FL0662B]
MPPTFRKPTIPSSPARTARQYHHRHSASSSTRKLSASFVTDGPLSSQPTTAYSSVTAAGGPLFDHPGPLTSHPITAYSTALASSSSGNFDRPSGGALGTSHTFASLPASSICRKDARQPLPSNLPLPKAPAATTYTTASSRFYPYVENIPPSSSAAGTSLKNRDSSDISSTQVLPEQDLKAKSKSRGGIPRSRTFNVLSNITSSLSRTSLGSFTRNESRQASTSSIATNNTATSLNAGNAVSGSSQSLLKQHAGSSRTPLLVDQRQIHTAQSSEYWTGRFLALQDRFHSEMLLPENLTNLVNVHAERSWVPPVTTGKPAASLPNSFTTALIYAPNQSQNQPEKGKHRQTPSNSTAASGTSTSKQYSSSEAAGLLADEDHRDHRVFKHLEALCTTSEARKSLHAWQQGYARRMGKANLLPKGGTMEDKDKGWVGRLFSSGGQGKRGSFVL